MTSGVNNEKTYWNKYQMHTYVLELNLIVEILNTSQKQLKKVRYAFIIL